MDAIIYFLRDKITGGTYLITTIISIILIFGIIGYLYDRKFGKVLKEKGLQ